jgi:hypothetical protein
MASDAPQTSAEETPREKLARLRARLSVEQRMFCEYYLDDLDAAEAYQKAFGTKTTKSARSRGYALLNKWYIQDFIACMLDAADPNEALVTKAEVVTTVRDVMRFALEDKDRIAAAALLMKYLGLDVKRVQGIGADGKPIDPPRPQLFVGLSNDQVREIRSKILGVDVPAPEHDDANS